MTWLARLIADPVDGTPSSTRVAALLCTTTGCLVALCGVVLGREQSATVMALLGGATGMFFSRRKAESDQGGAT